MERHINMKNILVCDDERDIVNAVKIHLSSLDGDPYAEGDIKIWGAADGHEALKIASEVELHLILLDVMMPNIDGISVLTKLRETSNVPVILLTAKSEDEDKVRGLNAGADDYVTKPFSPAELKARVRSQLRRYLKLGGHGMRAPEEAVLTVGGIELDERSKSVTVDGEAVSLTPTEYEILRLLMVHRGKVFSPREIYEEVWGGAYLGSDNNVAVHIRHLREKVEIDPAEPRYLKVIWGQGYRIDDAARDNR